MEKTIRVTGKSRIFVRPDTTRIIMTIEGKKTDYSETLELASEMTEMLKSALEQLEFQRSEMKTLAFSVEPRYESYQDKDKGWKQRFVGYEFRHQLKVEFPSDNERLGRLLYTLGQCKAAPELQIEYTVADPEAVKNDLLAKAFADSRAKADVLAKAANVPLGDILTMDYSWNELEIVARPMMMNEMRKAAYTGAADSYSLDVEPDDIEVYDTVTVVWAIA